MQEYKLEFWIDMNLPPAMAKWLIEDFNVAAKSFKELHFEKADDSIVFKTAANKIGIVVITTKDIDFRYLSKEFGSPPKILYFNIRNVSNKVLKEIIYKHFTSIIKTFTETDESLIEILNI